MPAIRYGFPIFEVEKEIAVKILAGRGRGVLKTGLER
jgi:hypothetical protein